MITAIILLALIFITIELFYQSKKLKNTHHVIRSLTKQINYLRSDVSSIANELINSNLEISNLKADMKKLNEGCHKHGSYFKEEGNT